MTNAQKYLDFLSVYDAIVYNVDGIVNYFYIHLTNVIIRFYALSVFIGKLKQLENLKKLFK